MNTLAPKLVLTPLLVASTSLAGRRWGPSLSGWFVALPLTSGPIVLFIAVEAGTDVAQLAAGGALIGATAQVAFAAAYTLMARRRGWIPSLVLGALAFFAVGLAIPPIAPIATYGLLLAAVVASIVTLGRRSTATPRSRPLPAWDIPVRVAVATALVIAISALAPIIGGRASGILATFPVYAAVLATFAHATDGGGPASDVLRGLAAGLIGFGAFFLALGYLLGVTSIPLSFLGALSVGLVVQTATLPLVRRAAHREEAVTPAGVE